MIEKTLVLLKPDALKRGLIGDIIGRFERAGLKVVAAKMVDAPPELIEKHYEQGSAEVTKDLGSRVIKNHQEDGIDVKSSFGTTDPYEIGVILQKWNAKTLSSGPILALVISGPHVIDVVRKIRGATMPFSAAPGTISGDYSFDSGHISQGKKRAVRNLVHASANPAEAEYEINLWFKADEIHDYKTVHQDFMLDG